MKIPVLNTKNEETGRIELPAQFNEPVNHDIIKRAVLAVQANKRQRYGASPDAGKRASVRVSKRRRDFRGSYGHGISRAPRKVMSSQGRRFNWTGAFAPQTVGGRRAHPPKAKDMSKKINEKENRKAIRSAISATVVKGLVEKKHRIPEKYPFAIDSSAEEIGKTQEAKKLLETIGFGSEIRRTAKKKIRAGKGKMRGRKYRRKKGPLIIVSKACNLLKSARNIPGIDVVEVKEVNSELLAPGTKPGRAAIFTEAAIKTMEKEGLFL